ncbi:hypothetical protein Tco_0738081 [Tanacetum coccineum]
MRNNDLRTKLEYFSEDYDEEREMEPRPEPIRVAIPPLRAASPRVQQRWKAFRRSIIKWEWNAKMHFRIMKEGISLLKILGLHEDQQIFGFIHGLRTRRLVEHLSIDLPPTYTGVMEKRYIWIEAREVATNGVLSDRRDSFERPKKSSWDNKRGQKNKDRFSPYRGTNHGLLSKLSKSQREILATERAAKSFEPPAKMFISKLSRDTSKYCHYHEDYRHDTNDCRHLKVQIQEAINSGQLSHLVKGIKKEKAKYGYCKNYKKTVKTGQTRTRERKENTRARRMLSRDPMIGRMQGQDQMDEERGKSPRSILGRL